jgi:serine phosphatase RsbU (regulator of sigma subunit)
MAARFDLDRMVMECVGGGHLPTMLFRPSSGEVKEVESRCGMIGANSLFCDPEPITEVAIEKGDYLLFYTDGLTEATNVKGEPFGRDRVIETVVHTAEHNCDGRKLSNCVVETAKTFTGGHFQDDVLVLAVEIR